MSSLDPRTLVESLQDLIRRRPRAHLVKNRVGNLAVVEDRAYLGFVDLRDGSLFLYEEAASPSPRPPLEEGGNG